jgi:hypothetical protein
MASKICLGETPSIQTPDRKEVPLRLRHPEAKAIQSVTVNGKTLALTEINGEWINLPTGTKQTLQIVANY